MQPKCLLVLVCLIGSCWVRFRMPRRRRHVPTSDKGNNTDHEFAAEQDLAQVVANQQKESHPDGNPVGCGTEASAETRIEPNLTDDSGEGSTDAGGGVLNRSKTKSSHTGQVGTKTQGQENPNGEGPSRIKTGAFVTGEGATKNEHKQDRVVEQIDELLDILDGAKTEENLEIRNKGRVDSRKEDPESRAYKTGCVRRKEGAGTTNKHVSWSNLDADGNEKSRVENEERAAM